MANLLERAGIRLDPEPLATDWEPPRRPRPWRRFVPLLVTMAVIAAGVGVWAAGGFRPRQPFEGLAPGDTAALGQFDVTFTDVVMEFHGGGDHPGWRATAHGTIRNATNVAAHPEIGEGGIIAAQRTDRRETVWAHDQIIDAKTDVIGADVVPGLRPVPYRVQFDFPRDYRPQGKLPLSMSVSEYDPEQSDANFQVWTPTSRAYVVWVPVTVIKP